jgi:CRP-like cAMP-binding protein
MAGKYETAQAIYTKLGDRDKILMCNKALAPSGGDDGSAAARGMPAPAAGAQGPAGRDSLIGLDLLSDLSKSRLMSNLNPAELSSILMYVRRRHARQGDRLVEFGRTSDALFIVTAGKAEISITREGEKIPLATISAGEHFGEISALFDRPATADVTAAGEIDLLFISRSDLRTLLVTNPVTGLKLCNVFLRVLSDRLASTNELVDVLQL